LSVLRAHALVLLVLAACAEDVPPPLEPGEFRLEPSSAVERTERRDPGRGTLERRGLSLQEHVAEAWQVPYRDLELLIELPPGTFDLRVRATDGGLEQARAMIRGGLAEHFGFDLRSEKRPRDVFLLRVTREGLRPEPVDPDAVTGERVHARGRYRGAGATIGDLAAYLRNYERRQILDETGLSGHYDIVIEWDPDAGARALHSALRDAGLVLVPTTRTTTAYVVEARP
jgi:uncharacterized protein (TIGR03435 family)